MWCTERGPFLFLRLCRRNVLGGGAQKGAENKKERKSMKKLKQFVCGLLAMALLACALPAASAAGGSLTVMGTDIAAQPGGTMQCGGGTAAYDAASKTLTLENASLHVGAESGDYGIQAKDELTLRLVGSNTIEMENGMNAIFAWKTLNITGGGTLSVTSQRTGIVAFDVFTIDGAAVQVTSLDSAGWNALESQGGFRFVNGASVTAATNNGVPIQAMNGRNGSEPFVYVENSKVNAPIQAYKDITLINSEVTADGVENGLLSLHGNIAVSGGTVRLDTQGSAVCVEAEGAALEIKDGAAVTLESQTGNAVYSNGTVLASGEGTRLEASAGLPAVWSAQDVKAEAGASVAAQSSANCAIYSDQGQVALKDCAVRAASPVEADSILGSEGVCADGVWLESEGGMLDGTAQISNSAVFQDGKGAVKGELAIPADVAVTEGMTLSIPKDTALRVPAGRTFTNHGEILLEGVFENQGGTVICTSHVEGITGEKAASCTAPGYTGDTVCRICGQMVKKGAETEKLAHTYKNGKCTVCGAAQPGEGTAPAPAGDAGRKQNPKTGV